jgi:hypothetical protein
MGLRVQEEGGSEGHPVMGWIGAVALPGNRADFPLGSAHVNLGQTTSGSVAELSADRKVLRVRLPAAERAFAARAELLAPR